jgi:hypothetical protein
MPDSERPNPYAPPETEAYVPDQDRPSGLNKGLRIAGGVVMLLVGLWSLLGGGCSVVAGATMSSLSEELSKPSEADQEQQESFRKLGSTLRGLLISGIVILVAGLLCNVSGVLLFLNHGKVLGLVAAGLGIIGEVLFFTLIAFNVIGLVKVAAYAFGGFCATRVDRRAAVEATPMS